MAAVRDEVLGAFLEPGGGAPYSNPFPLPFLEQKYGYYHCKDCNIRWESAYVWCVQGTNKVYFKQFCRTCQKSYNPYRVEDITCQTMLVWDMESSPIDLIEGACLC
nr:zygote arrest protein 1 [Cavia porcellus]